MRPGRERPEQAFPMRCCMRPFICMENADMAVMTRGINIKIPDTLRTRADTCAKLIGATVPEFVRKAIRDKCAEVEKLHGQRERAREAAADGAA